MLNEYDIYKPCKAKYTSIQGHTSLYILIFSACVLYYMPYISRYTFWPMLPVICVNSKEEIILMMWNLYMLKTKREINEYQLRYLIRSTHIKCIIYITNMHSCKVGTCIDTYGTYINTYRHLYVDM